jgi:hypothetical protein
MAKVLDKLAKLLVQRQQMGHLLLLLGAGNPTWGDVV